jgi:hypothetical protein
LYIPHTPAECKCIAVGRYCHGVHAATTDPDRITAWARQMPDALWGVAAGPSGLIILDVDRHGGERPATEKILPDLELPEDVDPSTIHDGLDVLALLCEIRKAPLLDVAPRTLTVRTPSGGLHYWFWPLRRALRRTRRSGCRHRFGLTCWLDQKPVRADLVRDSSQICRSGEEHHPGR